MAMGPNNNHFTLIDRKPRKIGLRSSASGEEGLEFSDQALQPGAIGQRPPVAAIQSSASVFPISRSATE